MKMVNVSYEGVWKAYLLSNCWLLVDYFCCCHDRVGLLYEICFKNNEIKKYATKNIKCICSCTAAAMQTNLLLTLVQVNTPSMLKE